MNSEIIEIPRKLAEKVKKRKIDIETEIIDYLIKKLELNPDEEAKIHLELAEKFLKEGKNILNKDPIQASEKFYKVAEECIKALALHKKYSSIIEKVKDKGRWGVNELDKSAIEISKEAGEWFIGAWDSAWTLHVWGFHETKLDKEEIKERIKYIEKIFQYTTSIIK